MNCLNDMILLSPKNKCKTDGEEKIHNFMLKSFAYLDLWDLVSFLLLITGILSEIL